MPPFTSNYPFYQPGKTSLLSTPERTGAPDKFIGRGVVIAFVDSGFYPHPDLKDRVLLHVDASTRPFVEGHTIPVSNLSWHGQMTSVIAAGDGRTSNGKYRGIASGAQVILIKVSDPDGRIKEHDILRGMLWLMENYKRWQIKIVNISVGGDFKSTDPHHPLHAAVETLVDCGVTVTVAAGNSNQHNMVPPASAPKALTIGGVDDQNSLERGRWSAYHHTHDMIYTGAHKPEILAPAAWVASPLLPESKVAEEARWLGQLLNMRDVTNLRRLLFEGWADLGIPRHDAIRPNNNLYTQLQERIHHNKLVDAHHQYVDGTSVAAPIVASIIAQMLEANPHLTPKQIRNILTSTATALPHVSESIQGAGVVNAAAAVIAAQQYLKT